MVSADVFFFVCDLQMKETEDGSQKSEEKLLRTSVFKSNNRITILNTTPCSNSSPPAQAS
jgi:hypothetical protein